MNEQENINTTTGLVIYKQTGLIINSTQKILDTFYSNFKSENIINKGDIKRPFDNLILAVLEV